MCCFHDRDRLRRYYPAQDTAELERILDEAAEDVSGEEDEFLFGTEVLSDDAVERRQQPPRSVKISALSQFDRNFEEDEQRFVYSGLKGKTKYQIGVHQILAKLNKDQTKLSTELINQRGYYYNSRKNQVLSRCGHPMGEQNVKSLARGKSEYSPAEERVMKHVDMIAALTLQSHERANFNTRGTPKNLDYHRSHTISQHVCRLFTSVL